MKNLVFVLAAVCLASCSSPESEAKPASKSNKYAFAALKLESLLPFFENASLVKNEILWKPSAEEQEAFQDQFSDDGFLHTILDTVLQHEGKHYMILHTVQYLDGQLQDCHACAPVTGIVSFARAGTGYRLLNFNKSVFHLGSYGAADGINFDKLFNENVFRVDGGWTGGGTQLVVKNYYSTENFGEIFSYTEYESNGGMYHEGEANYEMTESRITQKTKSSFVLETSVEKFDSLGVKSTEEYAEWITKNASGIQRKRTNPLQTKP